MPILSELRRRKVYQSVGLYLAVAWVVLQVGSSITELWDSPTWVLRALFILLVAGIPVVFIISWLFDHTGAGLVATDAAPRRGLSRLIATSVLVLLGVLVVAVYSWPDDPLSEDVRRLRETTFTIEADTRTFSYGLFGFNAPSGEDFWQHGRHNVTTYNGLGELPSERPSALRFTVERGDLCRLREPGCHERLEADARGIESLLAANAELLDRYRALRSASSHANVIHVHWDSPIPAFTNLFIAQALVNRDLWRRDDATASAMLAEEFEFHRVLLAESQSTVGKMIAAAMLEEDIRLYAHLVSRGASLPAPARLTPAELSLIGPYRWEAVSIITAHERGRDALALWLFERPLDRAVFLLSPYLPNRTVNALVGPIVDAAAASTRPAAEVDAWRAATAESEPPTSDWLVNAAGSYLVRDTPDFLAYVERVHDTDALIVLAHVVRRAIDARVDAATIGGFLLALPPELRHPVDGRPPTWADGVLSFADRREHRGAIPLRLDLPLTAR